jgi:ATP-dependent helicase/nuclease subunit A
MNVAIACDPNRSVVVEACAGSGKTWLLTARILRCLLQGTPPGAILALTFTNKAAAEMQSRLWQELQRLAMASSDDRLATLQSWGLSGEALSQALDQVPHAYERLLVNEHQPTIGTFHSWYTKLLTSAPVGVASLSSLSLTSRPHQFQQAIWQRFNQKLADHPSLELPLLIRQLGRSGFVSGLKDLMSMRGMLAACQFDWPAALAAGHQVLGQAQRANESDIQSWFAGQADVAASLSGPFEDLGDKPEAADILKRWDPRQFQVFGQVFMTEPQRQNPDEPRQQLRGRWITKKQQEAVWGEQASAYMNLVDQLVSGYARLAEQVQARWAQAIEKSLLACGALYSQAAQEVMRERDETDFDGLELAALQLIQSEAGPVLMSRLDCRYQQILVDECQDTNAVQWTILRSWLGAHVAAHGVDAQAPAVFMVGDPKQSIYRFRGADPRVFQAATQWLVTHYGAQVETTDVTRRCAPSIVALMNQSLGQRAPDRYRPHEAFHAQPLGAVLRLPAIPKNPVKRRSPQAAPVERDWLTEPESDAVVSEWFLEGQSIGQALLEARQANPDLDWQDIRVLLRARTHMADYERAFAQLGIPFVSDRTDGLLQTPEVEDLLNLCRWLAFPWSNADLAAVLRSPLVGQTDALLMALAEQSQSGSQIWWDALRAMPDRAGLVETLDRWRQWSAHLPVHDLFDRVLSEGPLLALSFAYGSEIRARQVRANWHAFLAWCLQWDAGRQPGVARFIQDMDELLGADQAELPAPGVDQAGLSAVRLQSLHSAKGLESRLVVLAGLADRDSVDSGVVWLARTSDDQTSLAALRACRRLDPIDDELRDLLAEKDRLADQEDFNLLYVGITRAREYLVISAAGEKTGSWYEQLAHCSPLAGEWVSHG